MSESNGSKQALDEKKVKEMRRLMAEGGDKAVEHRFGEQAKASPEYQRAAKQKAALDRQARRQREAMAKEATQNEARNSAQSPAPNRTRAAPKASARDRMIAEHRDAQRRDRERAQQGRSL